MLTHIKIENFALIKTADLECLSGMTVITGETGAGKSILLDALELTLGARADSSLVRPGAERCDIVAVFDISRNPEAQQWLTEKDLFNKEDNDCILKRSIHQDGRSRCFINNQPVPLQAVRFLASLLITIHGQHEHQSLMQRDAQRDLLDAYGNHQILRQEIKNLYREWHVIQEEIITRQKQSSDRESRLAFLQFQVQEFDQINITSEELDQLTQDHKNLAHAEQRIEIYQKISALLNNDSDQNILSQLQQALHLANTISKPALQDLLNNAIIHITEAMDDVQQYLDHTEINPEKLQQIEQRLTKIHDLARKHKIKIEQLPEYHEKLAIELQQLLNSDMDLEDLQNQLDKLGLQYYQIAEKLSLRRKQAAKKLAVQIEQHIQTLGMPGGKFGIILEPNEKNQFTATGLERIEFHVSANPGLPLQALSKVASGGELSRISLAIQAIAAANQALPTLIFDEVDVGIGGSTAAIVGQLLRQLASTTQIICITHLPQVASQGHQHWQVQKTSTKDQTQTQIKCLSAEDKVQEIARMLGGLTITQQTLAHAKELIGV